MRISLVAAMLVSMAQALGWAAAPIAGISAGGFQVEVKPFANWLLGWAEGSEDLAIVPKSQHAPIISEATKLALDGRQPIAVRQAAVALLGHLGANARSATPALLDILNGPDLEIHGRAVFALMMIDAAHVADVRPVVLRMLREGDDEADWFWGSWGPRADRTLVAEMGELLLDQARPSLNRLWILTKLRSTSRLSDPGAFNELLQILQALQNDAEPAVRGYATFLLCQFGAADAEQAVARLIPCLSHPEPVVRVETAIALSLMGMRRESKAASIGAVPALADAVASDDDSMVRMLAAYALQRIGPGAIDAVPALLQAAKRSDHPPMRVSNHYRRENLGVRHDAVTALGSILQEPGQPVGKEASASAALHDERSAQVGETVPLLTQILTNPKEETRLRQLATRSLARVAPKAATVALSMAAIVHDPDADPALRREAASALPRMEVTAPEVRESIRRALLSEDRDLVIGVLRALRRDSDIAPFASEIRGLAAHRDAWVSAEATALLGRLAASQPDLFPELLRQLGRPESAVIVRAIEAISTLKPGPKETVPALIQALNRTWSGSSGDAAPRDLAQALGTFHSDAVEAVPILRRTLERSSSAAARQAAFEALMQILPRGNDREEVLLTALRDEHNLVRREALIRIERRLSADLAAKLVPQLQRLLEDADVVQSWELEPILQAVEKLGPAGKQFLPVLESLYAADRNSARSAALASTISRLKQATEDE